MSNLNLNDARTGTDGATKNSTRKDDHLWQIAPLERGDTRVRCTDCRHLIPYQIPINYRETMSTYKCPVRVPPHLWVPKHDRTPEIVAELKKRRGMLIGSASIAWPRNCRQFKRKTRP